MFPFSKLSYSYNYLNQNKMITFTRWFFSTPWTIFLTNSGKISRLKSVTVFTGKSDVIANTQHNVFIRVLYVSSAGVVSVVSVLGATSLNRYETLFTMQELAFWSYQKAYLWWKADMRLQCSLIYSTEHRADILRKVIESEYPGNMYIYTSYPKYLQRLTKLCAAV